jgi:hypothetical protein
VLVIPAETADEWTGWPDNPFAPESNPNDHRMSAIGGIGWIEVGGTTALVLDFDVPTQFVPLSDGGAFIRSDRADLTIDQAKRRVRGVPKTAWRVYEKALVLTEGKMFAFDGTFPGACELEGFDPDARAIEAELGAPGRYDVWVAELGKIEVVRLVQSGRPQRKPRAPRARKKTVKRPGGTGATAGRAGMSGGAFALSGQTLTQTVRL